MCMSSRILKSDFDLTQILNGVTVMAASPFGYHQQILRILLFRINSFIESSLCGELFISPLDVILKKDLNVVQPDLIYIKKENLSIFHPEGHIQGVPDLLIEIVSPSSVPRDTVEKFRIYESYGVNEYWIVFPEQKVIEVFTLEDGKYVLFCSTELAEDMAKSKVIPNLEIKNKDIFSF